LIAAAIVLAGCRDRVQEAGSVAVARKIVIGVQPNEKDRDLTTLGKVLSDRIGLGIEVIAPSSYEDLVRRFKEGAVQFAFFSPLNFIQAEREAGAKALLKKVYGKSEFYYAAIVVRADSKFRKLEDLAKARFGFVDPRSTSGFLYPRVMTRKAGFDPVAGPHEFWGTHQAAVQALLDNKVQAIGVWSDDPALAKGAWTDEPFTGVKAGTFRVLAVSDPIPNDAFAVEQSYYEKNPMVVFKMMEAMIQLGEDPSRLLKKVFNVDQMATATSRHYDSVRSLEPLLREAPGSAK
jgi:phosphonate transport system substrate-binding protein